MRQVNAAAQALLARMQAGERIPMVQLVELDYVVVGGTSERYATAGLTLTWNGQTWQGVSLRVEPIDDTDDDVQGVTFVLPGVTDAQIALALAQPTEGTPVRIYDAIVDPDTGVVADAVLAFAGETSLPGIQDGPEATVSVLCEHRGAIALRQRSSAYTNDEQQRLYAGDTCLDFDPATDAKEIQWPAASHFKQ